MIEPPKFHIFGDESSHVGHNYLVYGTMDCLRSNISEISHRLRDALRGRREYKWSGELSNDLLNFVDVVFFCRSHLDLNFRCMVVNAHNSNHAKYNDGDAYIGLEKYIFFHLLGYARRLHPTSRSTFYVQIDKLKDGHNPEGLKRALNGRVANELKRPYTMFSDVLAVESQSQVLVQAADVFAGCVAWVWNKHYLNNPSPRRVALAEKIAKLANLDVWGRARTDGVQRGTYLNFGYPTRRNQETHGFAIWEMDLLLTGKDP